MFDRFPADSRMNERRHRHKAHRQHEQRKKQNGFPKPTDALFLQSCAQHRGQHHGDIGDSQRHGYPAQNCDRRRGPQQRRRQKKHPLQEEQHRRRTGEHKAEHIHRSSVPRPNATDHGFHTPVGRLSGAHQPAEPLMQRGGKVTRLFIVKHRFAHKGDGPARRDLLDRKFAVLRHGPGVPPLRPQNLHFKRKAGAADHAGHAEIAAGPVKKTHQKHPIQGITAADPRFSRVDRFAVSLGHVRAVLKRLIHPGQKVGRRQVVGVEHANRVKPVGIILPDTGERPLQRITLADLFFIVAFIYRRAVRPGRAGRIVLGTVVGDDKHLITVLRVILRFQTVEKLADDRFLMPGTDDHGKPQPFFCWPAHPAAQRSQSPQCRHHIPSENRQRQAPRNGSQGIEQKTQVWHGIPLPDSHRASIDCFRRECKENPRNFL